MLLQIVVGAFAILVGIAALIGSRMAPPADDDITWALSFGPLTTAGRLEMVGVSFTLLGVAMVAESVYRLLTHHGTGVGPNARLFAPVKRGFGIHLGIYAPGDYCNNQFIGLGGNFGWLVGAQGAFTYNSGRYFIGAGPMTTTTPSAGVNAFAGTAYPIQGSTARDVIGGGSATASLGLPGGGWNAGANNSGTSIARYFEATKTTICVGGGDENRRATV
jgi:hypothetical protein